MEANLRKREATKQISGNGKLIYRIKSSEAGQGGIKSESQQLKSNPENIDLSIKISLFPISGKMIKKLQQIRF